MTRGRLGSPEAARATGSMATRSMAQAAQAAAISRRTRLRPRVTLLPSLPPDLIPNMPSEPTPQPNAPLAAAWQRARARRDRPLQIPGHKNRYGYPGAVLGSDLLAPLIRDDIPMQGGADDNAYSGGFLDQAEALWAQSVGADHARFLVGGSSQGNISALTAVGGPGVPIAVDRTSHRSALAGLVISGSVPHWIYPKVHPVYGLPIGVPASAISELPGTIEAVFVTAPSYVGTIADVRALARACHSQGRILVVDQAWGAHLGFMPGRGAIELGADLVTTSVHKALMGYSQTAVVAVAGDRVSAARLDRAVDLVATTSPSGTLMASIDATREVMDTLGQQALEEAFTLTARLRRRLRRVPGLVVVDESEVGVGYDPLKVTLWLPRTGASGIRLAADLSERGHGVESADLDSIVMTMSILDEPDFFEEVGDLLVDLIERQRGPARSAAPAAVWQVVPEVVMTPRDAFYAPRRRVPMQDAVGEVSAEQFCPYPPGIPLVAPGERVTADVVANIREAGRSARVAYCSDPTLRTIEVVT